MWSRDAFKSRGRSSFICSSFLDSFPLINHALSWAVERGILTNIGLDLNIRLDGNYKMSRNLISHLHQKKLVVLQRIWKVDVYGQYHWISA